MILRAMPAVAWLLAGPPMPDRSKVVTQVKRDTLVLQVGGWGMGLTTHPHKIIILLENRPTVLKMEEDSRSK
jgi:hypothetical protein